MNADKRRRKRKRKLWPPTGFFGFICGRLRLSAVRQFGRLGLRWVGLLELLLPFGGLVQPAGLLVKLDQARDGLLEASLAVGGDFALSLLHAFVAGEEQRLGFGVFLLPQETASQQAASTERPPVVRNAGLAHGQAFARGGLGFRELALRQADARQVVQ